MSNFFLLYTLNFKVILKFFLLLFLIVFTLICQVSNFIESDSPLISHVARTHHLSLVTFFSAANTELSTLQVELRDRHKNYVEKELRITGDYDGNISSNIFFSLLLTLTNTKLRKHLIQTNIYI